MLVDEHAERDAIGVEAVEEVLDVAAVGGVEVELLLVLDDALSHGGDHVVVAVADLDQELQEAADEKGNGDGEESHRGFYFYLLIKKTKKQYRSV